MNILEKNGWEKVNGTVWSKYIGVFHAKVDNEAQMVLLMDSSKNVIPLTRDELLAFYTLLDSEKDKEAS